MSCPKCTNKTYQVNKYKSYAHVCTTRGCGQVRCGHGGADFNGSHHEELEADLVVCATGFRITPPPVSIGTVGGKRRACNVKKEQPLLYRSMVFPNHPGLSTILFNSMGVNAMLSAEVMAAWLANFYRSSSAPGKARHLAEDSDGATCKDTGLTGCTHGSLANAVAADLTALRARGSDGQ